MMRLPELLRKAVEEGLPSLGNMYEALGGGDELAALIGATQEQRESSLMRHIEQESLVMTWAAVIGYYYAMKKVGDEIRDAKWPRMYIFLILGIVFACFFVAEIILRIWSHYRGQRALHHSATNHKR